MNKPLLYSKLSNEYILKINRIDSINICQYLLIVNKKCILTTINTFKLHYDHFLTVNECMYYLHLLCTIQTRHD